MGSRAEGRSVDGPDAQADRRSGPVEGLGQLTPSAHRAITDARGRDFQRLEFVGDSVLEVILHAHSMVVGPGCPHCHGRADHFTTDAHLTEVARRGAIGTWLDWRPSDHRLADLVEACAGAAWESGGWSRAVGFVAARVHPLPVAESRRLLFGGAQVHRDAPARAREILGASILEAAASTGVFRRHPEGDEGDLSRIRARLLATEHVMGRCRDSRWVHRRLRRRHFDRDDVECLLADELLGRGIAAAVSIAQPLTR